MAHLTPPADWYPDPMGRHEHRYWDGHSWTSHVADRGRTSTDHIAARDAAPGHTSSSPSSPLDASPRVRPDDFRGWPKSLQLFFAELQNGTPNSFVQAVSNVGFTTGGVAVLGPDRDAPSAQRWLKARVNASTTYSSRTRAVAVHRTGADDFEVAIVECHLGDVNKASDLEKYPLLMLAVPLTETTGQFFLDVAKVGQVTALVKWDNDVFTFGLQTVKPPFGEVWV